MTFRFYILFAFFTLLFLFYPGDLYFFNIFADNPQLFNQGTPKLNLRKVSVPYRITGEEPQITAQGMYLVDLPSFTPIYERNSHSRFLPASTTKMITALVASDVFSPDDVVTVKRASVEGQIMDLVPGERITVENLLYGILVHSGNDAAFALADQYGYDKFIALMNAKAKALHMTDSQFRNPAGLDDPNQYSTPYDLALAARELLNHKLLSKIVSTKEIMISDIDFKYFHRLSNVNELLGEIQGIGGVKTGYTPESGENLISFYRKNGHDYLLVILKSLDRFTDTRTIVTWIDNNVRYTSI